MVMDQGTLVRTFLGELGTPAFLAGYDAGRSRLTVHVPAGYDLAALRARAKGAAKQAGTAIAIHVRAHRLRKLAHPRSLEHWLARFDIDEVVYDPTMIMTRVRVLVAAAKCCRARFGQAIDGLFFEPQRRTLFVVHAGNTDGAALSDLRLRIVAALDETLGDAGARRAWSDVQVVPVLPRSETIAVDRRSASFGRAVRHAARRWFAPIAVALAVAGTTLPAAANVGSDNMGPRAVSGTSRGMADGQFGILAGLSVFTDEVQRYEMDAFAAMGLHRYFAEGRYAGTGKLIHIARKRRTDCAREPARVRARDPDCVGSIPGRPREPKNVGQVPGAPAAPGS